MSDGQWAPRRPSGLAGRRLAAVLSLALLVAAGTSSCSSASGRAAFPCHPHQATGKKSAVALGDSITIGSGRAAQGEEASDSWFGHVVCDADPPVGYGYNAGVPGDTTGGMLGRYDRDVRSRHPGTLFLLGGTNDVTFGPGPDTAATNLGRIVDQARADGMRVVIGTLPPRDEDQFDAGTRALNDRIQKLAADRHLVLVDFSAVLSAGDDYRPGLTKDGVHPSDKGAELMAAAVRRALASGG